MSKATEGRKDRERGNVILHDDMNVVKKRFQVKYCANVLKYEI